MHDHDLIVIGSGPAGRRAAIQAAKLGKSVLVIDGAPRVGGASVHTGTIPSKTLRETVLNLTGWRERGFYGRAYRVKKDICSDDLNARLEMTLDHEVDVLEHQFARNGVAILRGAARFLDEHRIEVQGESGDRAIVSGAHVFIAVGTRPHRPAHVPFDHACVFDSDEILHLDHLPHSLTVVGAGVIGVEYATIFSALDVPVTLVEARSSFLDFIDRELIQEFVHDLRDRGMNIRLGQAVEGIAIEDGSPVVTLEGGRRIRSDMLLYAAGRVGAVDDLGLEAIGVDADDRGRIKVDPRTLQTSVGHIYAGGDVIGFPSSLSDLAALADLG